VDFNCSCTDFTLCVAGWDHFESNEVGFRDLYQMFRMVTEQVGQEPIIIDADDLLKQPGLQCCKQLKVFIYNCRLRSGKSNWLLPEKKR